jgi:NCS2 family nucleobase:cation symporter-2
MINGVQIMTSRLLDARRTMIISLSIIAASIVELFPSIAANAPPMLRSVVGSSLVLGTVTALALNLLFRIGIKKTAQVTIQSGAYDPDGITSFFQTAGAKWAARPDIVKRAEYAAIQMLDAMMADRLSDGPIGLNTTFDEFNLDVRVFYTGKVMSFPDTRPSLAQIRNSEDGARLLAGYMLRRNADRVRVDSKNGRATVLFHFDH